MAHCSQRAEDGPAAEPDVGSPECLALSWCDQMTHVTLVF